MHTTEQRTRKDTWCDSLTQAALFSTHHIVEFQSQLITSYTSVSLSLAIFSLMRE